MSNYQSQSKGRIDILIPAAISTTTSSISIFILLEFCATHYRHLAILLQQNLPFELDTVEYMKEEKEMDEWMMMEDDEYDTAMKSKQTKANSKQETETRIQMIKKMSSVDLEIDRKNQIIHFLGTESQMNVAYDLIKDILQNIEYVEVDDCHAQILMHQHFSTTHGDLEMSHKSLLSYISDECQVTLDLMQGYKEEIDALDVNRWHANIHKQQVNMRMNTSDSTQLLLMNNWQNSFVANRTIPNLYLVIYGNELRRKMVKDKLEHFVSTMELDTNSSINTAKPLEKLNREQRRLIFEIFKIKRVKTEK
eukprot:408766_1